MTTAAAGLFDLSGQVALVTGGGRGIGEVLAETLVRAGARVYISSRDADVCGKTAARLAALGECISVPEDLSTSNGVERLAAALSERETGVDILVNNAGVAWGEALGETTAEGWDGVMDLNLRSVFFLTQALLPAIRRAAARRTARIVNVGSVVGIRAPTMPTFAYSVSKAGVHHLTRMLALHLAAENIVVNAIAPGPFATRMMERVLEREGEAVLASVPRGRFGREEDLASAILYLCSMGSSYVTGHVLPIDGGLGIA